MPSLRDPSFGFNNYNAPGADRYKLSLSPKRIEFDGLTGSATGLTFNTENYFEVVRVVNGETTKGHSILKLRRSRRGTGTKNF